MKRSRAIPSAAVLTLAVLQALHPGALVAQDKAKPAATADNKAPAKDAKPTAKADAKPIAKADAEPTAKADAKTEPKADASAAADQKWAPPSEQRSVTAPELATTGTAPPAAEPPPVEQAVPTLTAEQTRAVLEHERARLRALMAARRKTQPKPEPRPVIHGDAGAMFAMAFVVEQVWNADRAYDLFDDDDHHQRAGVWLGFDILSLTSTTIVAAELGWISSTVESNNVFDGLLTSELHSNDFHGGFNVRYVITDWLQPHLRAAGGASLAASTLRLSRDDATVEESRWGGFGAFGAGFTLRSPTRLLETEDGELASVSLGLMVEGGYTVAAPLEFDLAEDVGEHDLPVTDAQLGDMKRSGPYLRTSIVLRF